MILQAAIDEYLDRELDSHVGLKQLTAEELDAELAALNPKPVLYPGMRLHQKACFLLGVAYPKFSFWLDMGTGKTLLALMLLRYWYQIGVLRRAIIFVTSDKAFPTWEAQIERFGVDVPYVVLDGSSVDKWEQLYNLKEGFVIVTYPGAVAMTSESVVVKGKRKWQLNDKRAATLAKWADGFVLDESTKAGHRTSLTYKLIARLKRRAKVRYNLAGRPFGRDPTMLWVQQYLVDDGESLGETQGLFEAAFFTAKKNWAAEKFGGPRGKYAKELKFKKSMQPQLSAMAQHRSITYSADECIDLPPVQFIEETVSFSVEALEYYRSMVKQAIKARGNLREMENVFLRMRQISSGFVSMKDDSERVEIEFEENPKLDRLLELAEALPDDRKMLISYEFTRTGKLIYEQLQELGLDPIWIWSGNKDYAHDMRRFQKDKKCGACVLNNRIGAYSLDGLQVANYGVVFESPLSGIDREQLEKRLVRDGQLHKVFWYDLLVKGSVDQKIRSYHADGKSLFEALLRDPSSVL